MKIDEEVRDAERWEAHCPWKLRWLHETAGALHAARSALKPLLYQAGMREIDRDLEDRRFRCDRILRDIVLR